MSSPKKTEVEPHQKKGKEEDSVAHKRKAESDLAEESCAAKKKTPPAVSPSAPAPPAAAEKKEAEPPPSKKTPPAVDASVPAPAAAPAPAASFFSFGKSSSGSPFAMTFPTAGGARADNPFANLMSPAASAGSAASPFNFAAVSSSSGAPLFSSSQSQSQQADGDENPEAEVPPTAGGAPVGKAELSKEQLTTGEEGEVVVMDVNPMKIYKLVDRTQWSERGKGSLHLNRNKETGRCRVIVRAEATMRIILNSALWAGMTCSMDKNTGKAISFNVPEQQEEEPEAAAKKDYEEKKDEKKEVAPAKKVVISTYSVRVRTKELATELCDKINACVAEIKAKAK